MVDDEKGMAAYSKFVNDGGIQHSLSYEKMKPWMQTNPLRWRSRYACTDVHCTETSVAVLGWEQTGGSLLNEKPFSYGVD